MAHTTIPVKVPVFERELTVKMTYSDGSGNYFVDFWDSNGYIVSVKLNENVANCISRDLGIKISK